MPITLKVVSAEEYSEWVDDQNQPQKASVAKNSLVNEVVSVASTSVEQEGGM
jgi:heme/copper-type cytochrome/quinol oxidase subunit 2